MSIQNKFKLHYWPILTSVWFIISFITSYIIAVTGKHVYPLFPFVSDTGTLPPESCLFAQMLNVGAVILGITMYIRYQQIDFAIQLEEVHLNRKWNEVAFWLGNLSCLGVSIVGNFQETSLMLIHCIGAFMAFGIGGVYLLLQTKMSFALKPIAYKYPEYGPGNVTLYLRTMLNLLFFGFLSTTVVCAALAFRQFKGKDVLWWTEKDGGFELHLIATFSEWLLLLCFIIYTGTAANEFKSLEFEEIRFMTKCSASAKNKVQELS